MSLQLASPPYFPGAIYADVHYYDLIDMLFHFFSTNSYNDPKNDDSNIYGDMLFYFHSVFWHAIDVVVILLITPSMPFHCPCLQDHFLYLPLKDRAGKKYSQYWEAGSSTKLENT